MKITTIKKVKTEPVYDFTVDTSHHYILENGVITHNSGLEYAASTIIFLSKKKDKTDNEVTGSIVTAVLKKGRLTIENKKVETLLEYRTGLDPYYGLLDIAEKTGLVKKISTKYVFPNGESAFEKHILNDPEKYFTPELMDQIDQKCKEEFLYGTISVMNDEKPEGKHD